MTPMFKSSGKYFAQRRKASKAAATTKLSGADKATLAIKTIAVDVATAGEFCNVQRRISHMLPFVTITDMPKTPAAVIENGTRDGQRVITGTLETLLDKSSEAGVGSPALIIIGSVVTLRDKLSWFACEETANE